MVALAGGAKGIEMPSMEQSLAEFNAWLIATPKVIDPERLELMEVLGVA